MPTLRQAAFLAYTVLLTCGTARAEPVSAALMQAFKEVCLAAPLTIDAAADRLRALGWKHGDPDRFELETPGISGFWYGEFNGIKLNGDLAGSPNYSCNVSGATTDYAGLNSGLKALGGSVLHEFGEPLPMLFVEIEVRGSKLKLGLTGHDGRVTLASASE